MYAVDWSSPADDSDPFMRYSLSHKPISDKTEYIAEIWVRATLNNIYRRNITSQIGQLHGYFIEKVTGATDVYWRPSQ
jgi:hypothetical protein